MSYVKKLKNIHMLEAETDQKIRVNCKIVILKGEN